MEVVVRVVIMTGEGYPRGGREASSRGYLTGGVGVKMSMRIAEPPRLTNVSECDILVSERSARCHETPGMTMPNL